MSGHYVQPEGTDKFQPKVERQPPHQHAFSALTPLAGQHPMYMWQFYATNDTNTFIGILAASKGWIKQTYV